MERLINNLSATVRRELRNGRQFLITPAVLVKEGVLTGSDGPLFYPRNETCKAAKSWEGIPVTVNHPEVNGQPVSAGYPGVWERQGIGRTENARCLGDRLLADVAIDIERLRTVDTTILGRLERGEQIELSTGLFVDKEPGTGVFAGRIYEATARNHKPNHVAILPEGFIGACSLRDGCGLSRNSAPDPSEPLIPPEIDWRENVERMNVGRMQPNHSANGAKPQASDEPLATPGAKIDWKQWAKSNH